jgi:hypothetical protein
MRRDSPSTPAMRANPRADAVTYRAPLPPQSLGELRSISGYLLPEPSPATLALIAVFARAGASPGGLWLGEHFKRRRS